MEDAPDKIKLKYPIKVSGVETDILTVRRLKVKHLRLLPKGLIALIEGGGKGIDDFSIGDLGELIPFFASIVGIPAEDAEEIDAEDLTKIADTLKVLLGK